MIYKIVSGGQTGVDRAALDVALLQGISCGGWCPKGRLAEDGAIDPKYPLLETPSASVSQRTEWNVRDSEATLILVWGVPTGGTLKAAAAASRFKKSFLIVDMEKEPNVEAIQTWIEKTRAHVLNVAGPRSSEVATAYDQAKTFLMALFATPDENEPDGDPQD